jgi:outer membrane protein assembly factor BamB
MKRTISRALVRVFLFALTAPTLAQTPLRFEEIAGWWSAQPVHAGESSHIALQFLEKDGKPEGRLWLMAIGAYDIPLGEVTIDGHSINTKEPFPLTWNPVTGTLSGTIPADAAPVYDIPLEFKRRGPAEEPPVPDWKSLAPPPRVVWSVDTGAPVWAGLERDAKTGLLFVGNEQGVLLALDRDGRVRWKFETGKPIRAQPKVIGRDLYVSSDSGFLYKLDASSGVETWRAQVDITTEPRLPSNDPKTRWDRYGSSVAADPTHIYVSSRDKHLYALDARTGREVWRVKAGDIMTATPALYRDLVIFAAYDGQVQAVSARDGKPRWSYDAKVGVPGDLVVAEDRVLAGSRSYDLIALEAATGKELWKHYYWFSWIESPPVVRDGVVYTGSSDATAIYAINLADGSRRWKSAVPGYPWQRVAVTDELVISGTLGKGAYPASRNGSFFALDRKTGRIRWLYLDPPGEQTVKAGKNWGFASSPALGDGVVYAADFSGRVHAFSLRTWP